MFQQTVTVKAFENIAGKGKNAVNQNIRIYIPCFPTCHRKIIILFEPYFYLYSAIAYKDDQTKMLYSVKELKSKEKLFEKSVLTVH